MSIAEYREKLKEGLEQLQAKRAEVARELAQLDGMIQQQVGALYACDFLEKQAAEPTPAEVGALG